MAAHRAEELDDGYVSICSYIHGIYVIQCGGVVLRVVVCCVVLVVACVVWCCACCMCVCVTGFSSFSIYTVASHRAEALDDGGGGLDLFDWDGGHVVAEGEHTAD